MIQRIDGASLCEVKEPLVVITLTEHLGDIVACEPVIRYAKEAYPGHKLAWILRSSYVEALIAHPLLDYLVPVEHSCESDAILSSLPEHARSINLHLEGKLCMHCGQSMHNGNDSKITFANYYDFGSLLEVFCQSAGLPRLNTQPEFHFMGNVEIPLLPEKYVVFHCRSSDRRRDWADPSWKKLLYFFLSRNLPVVEVGLEPVLHSVNEGYWNLTGLRSLQFIAKVIEGAHFFVGVDSAFAHVANALRVNGLVIMGKFLSFSQHVPYTGFYGDGHIVRMPDAPARDVPMDAVAEGYLRLTNG